jgi:uncharacterized protein (TIGR00730 family)
MHRVAVYCGSSCGHDARFIVLASAFGSALAAAGFGLVYGGGQVGLMGAVARGALATGGEVIGVIPRFLEAKELVSSPDPRVQLRVVGSMHERKALYYELAHAFVALPGGFGTLEEIFETLAWAHLGLVRGPIILLNDGGYYDDVLALLDRAVVAGFASARSRALISAETTVSRAVAALSAVG